MSQRKTDQSKPGAAPAAAGALNGQSSERLPSYLELLEENRLLHEEVRVSRQAAEITAELVVEQFAKMDEIHRTLEATNQELRTALDEIQTLRGTLPICANCKSIRDDEGYWNRIEAYLKEHAKAEFTHGLCPTCVEELYGQDDWYRLAKQGRQEQPLPGGTADSPEEG